MSQTHEETPDPLPDESPSSGAYYFDVQGHIRHKEYHFVIDAKPPYGNWSALFNAFTTYEQAPMPQQANKNCDFIKVIYFGLSLILVIALENIPAGTECLVDYGENYWLHHQDRIAEHQAIRQKYLSLGGDQNPIVID